jgi:hypothetical protein
VAHCVSASRARNSLPAVRAELQLGAARPDRTLDPAALTAAQSHGAVGVGAELEQCLSRSLVMPRQRTHGVAAQCSLPPAPINLRLVLRRRFRASRSAGYRAGCFRGGDGGGRERFVSLAASDCPRQRLFLLAEPVAPSAKKAQAKLHAVLQGLPGSAGRQDRPAAQHGGLRSVSQERVVGPYPRSAGDCRLRLRVANQRPRESGRTHGLGAR